MNMLFSVISVFFCTLASATLFNIKKKNLMVAATIGAVGWLLYKIVNNSTESIYISTFIAAAIVGISGEVVSRYKKAPATVFTLPGIIPLVPGAYIYYSMLSLVTSDYSAAAEFGAKTVFIALSISCGIIISLAFRTILIKLKPRI